MTDLVKSQDMFLDRQDRLQYRDLMNLMEFPFFSVSKIPVHEVRTYDDGNVRIEVKPGHAGLATIWDKDILIYVASQINRMLNDGIEVSQKVKFHAHDFFISCGRSAGGRAYEDLVASLDRLQSTSVRTNISFKKTGDIQRSFFSWIKSGRMTERRLPNGKTTLGMVEVEIDDWVWRQIVEDRSILQIDQSYFDLTSGIARRVYELARKHCGNKATWSIGLDKLASKIGYSPEDSRNFKRFLTTVVESNDLPEYTIHISLLGDTSDGPIESLRAHRGTRGLKAVFRRRSKPLAITAEIGMPSVATARSGVEPRPGSDDLASEDSVVEDRATAEDFKALVASLGKGLKVRD